MGSHGFKFQFLPHGPRFLVLPPLSSAHILSRCLASVGVQFIPFGLASSLTASVVSLLAIREVPYQLGAKDPWSSPETLTYLVLGVVSQWTRPCVTLLILAWPLVNDLTLLNLSFSTYNQGVSKESGP